MSKFDTLYKLIMEEFQANTNTKFWKLLAAIKHSWKQEDLNYIYTQNKEVIDNDEDLILAYLENPNVLPQFKNQFRNCPFESVQNWWLKYDKNASHFMDETDLETYHDFTNNEGEI